MGLLDGTTGGLFDDPNTVSMLGLAAGIANAARPSRLPVPFGAAMAEGFGSAMQFRNQALQNQRAAETTKLLTQEVQQRQFANLSALMQMRATDQWLISRGKPPMYGDLTPYAQQMGLPWNQGGSPLSGQGGGSSLLAGGAPAGMPPQLAQAAGVLGGAPSSGMPQAAPQGMPQAAPTGGAPAMTPPAAAAPANPNANFGPEDVGITARIWGPEAAKWEAAQHPPPMEIERVIRASGIDPASKQGQSMMRQYYLNTVNDPRYKGQIAGSEAWAKVGAAIAQKSGEAAIEAQHNIAPINVLTDEGPKQILATGTRREAIINDQVPNVKQAPQAAPQVEKLQELQLKTTIEPAQKLITDNVQTIANIKQMMAIAQGLKTGNLTPYIREINNAAQNLGLPQIDPKHFDAGKLAALLKSQNQLIYNTIMATVGASGGTGTRGNMLLFKTIQGIKPDIETPPEAIQSIGQNMIKMLEVNQERNRTLLNDASKAWSKSQALPLDWESQYWAQKDKAEPGWDQKLANEMATTSAIGGPLPGGVADPLGIRR